MKNLELAISEYVESKRGSWSPTTIFTARYKLNTCSAFGFEPAKLYQKLESDGYGAYTIQTYFTVARGFEEEVLKTTKIRQWTQQNRLRFKNCYKKKSKKMTEVQFKGFLTDASVDRDSYNFLVLIGRAGLRKSEALAVKWSDIKDGSLEVKSGKGGKQRFIPFKASWLKGDPVKGAILPANFNGYYNLKKLSSEFTPHDFRSFYSDRIVNMAGMSIEDARDLLGHESIETTARYLRADRDRQHKLIMENF